MKEFTKKELIEIGKHFYLLFKFSGMWFSMEDVKLISMHDLAEIISYKKGGKF